jgi:hypothetical protein
LKAIFFVGIGGGADEIFAILGEIIQEKFREKGRILLETLKK